MSYFNRVKSILSGAVMLLFALVLFMIPKDGYLVIVAVLSISLIFYGFGLLYYYFTMASHMVGGKTFLYQAVIVLDFSLFTTAVLSMTKFYVLIYMIIIRAFGGCINILRALEEKRYTSPLWKLKFISGIVNLAFVVILVIMGAVLKRTDILVYGYCISLAYSAIIHIAAAFQRTAIIFIQ